MEVLNRVRRGYLKKLEEGTLKKRQSKFKSLSNEEKRLILDKKALRRNAKWDYTISNWHECNSLLVSEKSRVNREILKREVLNEYGGCKCQKCSEEDIRVLTLDHVNEDGSQGCSVSLTRKRSRNSKDSTSGKSRSVWTNSRKRSNHDNRGGPMGPPLSG